MQANPRLRSWKSFGWLKFEIITHSITESALVSLSRQAVVHFEQLSRTFESTDWSNHQIEEVRALCRKYSAIRREPLGRQAAESLQVFGHTFGNGTPAVLRQTAGPHGKTWAPLLPHDRDYALGNAEMAALQGYRAPHSLVATLRRLGQVSIIKMLRLERVAAQPRNRTLPGRYGNGILALLTAIDAGYQSPVDLMKAGSMSLTRLHTVARAAYDLELIEGYENLALAIGSSPHPGGAATTFSLQAVELVLTDHGRQLLRRRARPRSPKLRPISPNTEGQGSLSIRTQEVKNSDRPTPKEAPPYYPQQLR